MRVRATVRLRNDVMISARSERKWSQERLAEEAEVHSTIVGAFERLDFDFYRDSRRVVDAAFRIARTLEVPTEMILPEGALGEKVTSEHSVIREVGLDCLLASDPTNRLTLSAPDEELEEIEETEILNKLVKDAIAALPSRLRRVMELRFGLKGNRVHNILDIAKRLSVTRSRVQQIEDQAERCIRVAVEKQRAP